MATRQKSSKPAKRSSAKPAKKPTSTRRPATARAQRQWPPRLESRDLDLIGLGLVAIGVFLACVMYLNVAGGRVGAELTSGIAFLVGQVAYIVPVALVAAGALMVARPFIPAGRPLRSGAVLAFLAITLMLAGGTLGLGPNGAKAGEWGSAFLKDHGGLIGEAQYTLIAGLASAIGAHIVALFLLLAGTLLITGASVAAVIAATGSTVRGAANKVAQSGVDLASMSVRRPGPAQPLRTPAPILVPEDDHAEVVVRDTHVEAPSVEADDEYHELFGDNDYEEDEPAIEAQRLDGDNPQLSLLDEPSGPGAGEPPAREAELDASELTPQGRYRDVITDDPDFEWHVPDPRFLKRSNAASLKPDTTGQEKVAKQLVEALGHFGVEAKIVGTVAGPHITRYELRLAPGTKVAKVAQLKDDIAYALAASDVRILAPIPGKQAVGVEVPNIRRRIVHLGDVFQAAPKDHSPLTVWLGKDVAGRAIGVDLAKMPHILVAGTTGAGKSGAVNAMLSSILLRATPHEVRLVLVDPKQVELNHYESIPHLLTPVITSPRMAANALQNLVKEMEGRYGTMALARTRSLPELNKVREKRGEAPLPYILCVIDELADLMMVAPADVENSIIRLAQKARAVGIHLVLATQSPRVDVITGMIKANVPSRIAFAVSSQTDSRVILDQNGAESLLGQGDMLFAPVGTSRLQRIQGAYIDEADIGSLTTWWRKQGAPNFRAELLEEVVDESDGGAEGDPFDPDEDPLLEDAISLVASMGTASTSMLQRRLRLGYTRAGRLIDMLERRGIISGYEGSKPRQVLVTEADLPRVLASFHGSDAALEVEKVTLASAPSDPDA